MPTELDTSFPTPRPPPPALPWRRLDIPWAMRTLYGVYLVQCAPCAMCTLCAVYLVCNVQMSKVASALLSGKYSSPPPSTDTPAQVDGDGDATAIAKAGDSDKGNKDDDMVWVAPRMFKHLVGQGHAEFSSGRQQDAAEYMQHLLEASKR